MERTLAWLSKCRAVLVRYDKKAANYLGVLQLACALLWFQATVASGHFEIVTKRDAFLIDIELDKLEARVGEYFNPTFSNVEIGAKFPAAMKSSSGFVVSDADSVRNSLLARGGPIDANFVRHAYRPFDTRWLYREAGHGLLGRPVPDYKPHLFDNNVWMVAQHKPRREWSPPQVISEMGCLDLIDRGATCFPAWLRSEQADGQQSMLDGGEEQRRPNLSAAAQRYLERLGLGVEDLFHHALAVLHDPAYREANAGALRMEWPRIPLPSWPDGDTPEAADDLRTSAARGRGLATLLDPETPAPGVTSGTLRPELATIAVPSTAGGHNIADDDFALTAGWGHFGTGDAVMPGTGYSVARDYTAPEREALGDAADALGDSTLDIHLNGNARWSDVPASVWNYKLGGYQVLKKWLSYREHKVLGRNMHPDEVRHFTDTARRIAAILMLTARP